MERLIGGRTKRGEQRAVFQKTAASGERPKLLFLCQSLPYPPDGGCHIRSYNILRLLSREFDVSALFFYRRRTRPTPDDVRRGLEGTRALGSAEAFPIPEEWSRTRLAWDHIRSLVTRRVYTRFVHASADFARELDRLLAENVFDIVHMDSLDLSGYMPRISHLPVVLTHHNVESQLLARRAAAAESPVLRRYLDLQSRLTAKEERRWCGAANVNVVVSDADGDTLRTVVDVPTVTVPNGVDTQLFQPGTGDRTGGILFVGGAWWLPNRDGMQFFCQKILPRVRAEIPGVPVTWVGHASQGDRDHYLQKHQVRLTGYVDSVEPFVQQAGCYVVPLRIGGGTRLKILDAWAMAAPIVSTSLGCEGLHAVDGENILVRDDPDAFARAICQVLGDERLRVRLGTAGRRTAEERFDWEVIGRDMLGHYRALITRPSGATSAPS